MRPVRFAKTALVAGAGLLFVLVGVNNLIDYGTNFDVVKHILAMDMIPSGPFAGRAIAVSGLHHLFYIGIICIELAGGVATLTGAVRLWRMRNVGVSEFNRHKTLALCGLASMFGLYFIGFATIGGEWFQMWRAGSYNMQEPAFRFIGSIGLIMIFLNQPEEDN
jgi:predicted small integral membrane protein